MEERVDEKILDYINESEEKEARKDIKNGPVKIMDRYYEFEEKDFFEEKLRMYIPKDFEEMSLKARKHKYQSENRPDIIKCNKSGSICITLKIINSPLDEEHVSKLKDVMKVIIKKRNPANVFYEDGVIEVNSKNLGFFEFKSYAIDASLYNLMFFLEFEGKTLMGTFSCKHTECKQWRDIAFQVIKTIVIEENKGVEN